MGLVIASRKKSPSVSGEFYGEFDVWIYGNSDVLAVC